MTEIKVFKTYLHTPVNNIFMQTKVGHQQIDKNQQICEIYICMCVCEYVSSEVFSVQKEGNYDTDGNVDKCQENFTK